MQSAAGHHTCVTLKRARSRNHRLYPCLPFSMVFRWGHSRSRASPFYLKIKTRGEGSESATAREKSRFLALALSRSRATRFLKPINFRNVWSFHVKSSRFYFYIKRRGSRSPVVRTEHHTWALFTSVVRYVCRKISWWRSLAVRLLTKSQTP